MDYQPILEPTVFRELPQDIIIDDIIILAQSCDDVIHWMRKFGLLARGMRCRCGTEMYETQSTHYQDGYEWRCSPCRSKCSIRYGSFFTPSKLPLPLIFKFLYYWTEDLQSHAFLEKHLGWSPNTVVDWKNSMRDICLQEILINPQPLGGPGEKSQTTNPDSLDTHVIETSWRRRHKNEIFNAIVRGIRSVYTVV